MAAQFDDFLTSLRAQMVRAAEAEARGAGSTAPRPSAAPRPWHVRPRIALAFVVGVLAPAAVVAVALVLSSGGGVQPAPVTNDTGATSALVQPSGDTPAVGSAAPQSSYSLAAVASLSGSDAWAVGSRVVPEQGAYQRRSFILRFDGSGWRETTTPDIGALGAVAVSPEGDAWALGTRSDAILAWDGSRWTTSPSGAPAGASLDALVALASDDVWAVGDASGTPLAVHFDGESWTQALLPATTIGAVALSSVSGSSTADVWAVGPEAGGRRGLVLHFDGVQWSAVTPGAVAGATTATADPAATVGDWPATTVVACAGPADVWVGGSDLVHFDGAAWTEASASASVAGAASVVSGADIWMTGADRRSVVHFDGSAWTSLGVAEMGVPVETAASAAIGGVAASSDGVVWVVGTTVSGAAEAPLVMRGVAGDWRLVVDSVRLAGASGSAEGG